MYKQGSRIVVGGLMGRSPLASPDTDPPAQPPAPPAAPKEPSPSGDGAVESERIVFSDDPSMGYVSASKMG
ncbi:MAG: hypothetical protein ABL998_00575 [Planctomycetota bacterium]